MLSFLHRIIRIHRPVPLVFCLPRRAWLLPCGTRAVGSGKGTVVSSKISGNGQSIRRRPTTSSAIPKMNDCASVTAVLEAHAKHGPSMKPIDLSACWNQIGKLAAFQHKEQHWLRRNRSALAPLLEHTKREVGRLPARPLANVTHGLSKITAATGWQAGADV